MKENKTGKPFAVPQNMIIIGGGNVALDAAREALRLQNIQHRGKAISTKTVSLEDWEIMPATKDEIKAAREEGIEFNPGWGPKEVVLDEKGKIRGLLCVKVKSVFDEKGRFKPSFYDEEKLLEGDMIIEAIGQAPDFSFMPEGLFDKLEFTERRKVKVDGNGQTSVPKVFAGGDIVNANLDAVTAIADAKAAAEGIDKLLTEDS